MLSYFIFLTLCLLAGSVVGVIGGMLGIGGGVIIVPVLLLLYSFSPELLNVAYLAIGTSLGTIFFTSLAASSAQIKRQAVNWAVVRIWVLPVMMGSSSAGYIAKLLPEYWLLGFIAIFLAIMATILATNWQPQAHRKLPGILPTAGIASAVGLSSGLAGIGGGNVIVPTLLYFNFPFSGAAAISSTLGVPIALAGALGFVWVGWSEAGRPVGSLGYVHIPAVAAIAVASMGMASVGVRLAHQIATRLLQRLLAVMLLVTSVRLAWLAYTGFGQ